LPISDGTESGFSCYETVEFRTLKQKLDPTHGGTGVVMIPLRGFFEIDRSVTGASTKYILQERDASLELRARMAN
jgi:hypothetical protein